MKFDGRSRAETATSEARWKAWCRGSARDRRQLQQFAERLTTLVESRVNARVHVAAVAEQALRKAGRDQLSDAQLRQVILMLYRVWVHGLSFYNWAKRRTDLLRDSD